VKALLDSMAQVRFDSATRVDQCSECGKCVRRNIDGKRVAQEGEGFRALKISASHLIPTLTVLKMASIEGEERSEVARWYK
jgi:hypothetical protein